MSQNEAKPDDVWVTYAMGGRISLDLKADEEGTAVEEKHVAFPLARVVVSLGVDSAWHGPNRSSSHFLYLFSVLY